MKHLRWTGVFALATVLVVASGCGTDDDDDVVEYRAELAGENQEPLVATPASGWMDVELDENTLRIDGVFEGLVSRVIEIEGTPIHIHLGVEGENGPVVFPIDDIDLASEDRAGTFSFERELSSSEIDTFEEGNFYLNIHTQAYPGGELRGQLDEAAPEFAGVDDSWGLEMTTDAQPHEVDSDAQGWAWVVLRDDDTLLISGAVAGLSSPLMEVFGGAVNLEEGAAGETGTMVFTLDYEAREDNEARFWYSTTLTEEQVDRLNDGDYFLTIYTENNPEGELRVQIDDDDTFFEDFWEDIFGDDDDLEEAPPF